MNALLNKEMRLSASILSYLFIGFGLMTLLPGYPILCGVFFVTLGLFQSFQSAREANDIVFSALLPVAGLLGLLADVLLCLILPNLIFFLCYWKTPYFRRALPLIRSVLGQR